MINAHLNAKREHLLTLLKQFDSLMVAFSGGVDSTFLLALAHRVLKNNLLAVTADSPLHPAWEKKEAIKFTKNLGVKHLVISSKEMNLAEFRDNPKDRCYICKTMLFEDLWSIAKDKGIEYIAHGATVDDLADFRPGFIAAKEWGIKAPLIDAELTKDDIRILSKEMNLKTWNKPAMACFATRIPYGTPITKKNLNMIARAEKIILDLGFTGCRVRLHDKIARLE
ncbi:MAG: ATP-dependent sacrificial sulfur transferase LarE, partial [Desulfobacterales bacterium]